MTAFSHLNSVRFRAKKDGWLSRRFLLNFFEGRSLVCSLSSLSPLESFCFQERNALSDNLNKNFGCYKLKRMASDTDETSATVCFWWKYSSTNKNRKYESSGVFCLPNVPCTEPNQKSEHWKFFCDQNYGNPKKKALQKTTNRKKRWGSDWYGRPTLINSSRLKSWKLILNYHKSQWLYKGRTPGQINFLVEME